MSGTDRIMVDTNMLIYLDNGDESVAALLDGKLFTFLLSQKLNYLDIMRSRKGK
jgi:hypothetical protein